VTRVPNAFPVAATASAGGASPAGLPPRRSPRVVGSALVALTKPRIIELLLVTTVPTMLLAQRGLPSVRLILVTLIGGTLAAGSANTINCYIDRDIDAVMKRTSRRPLVVNGQGTIKPWEALAWGILLGAGATLLLGLMANWLAASLADTAILFYIFVYTLLLKRRSPANIVIGGAAGCFPVLVGWAAVTGTVAVPAIVLFAVIFLWTPPHFWALAMKFRKDYAAANIPMLPVVASPATVVRKILWYSYAMVGATLVLIPYAGWIYGVFAAALGVWFLAEAHQLNASVAAQTAVVAAQTAVVAAQTAVVAAQAGPVAAHTDPGGAQAGSVAAQAGPAAEQAGRAGAQTGAAAAGSSPAPMRLFHLSIAYLTLLFAAVAVTALLPWGRW
jgi:protoheme IX farnesyltransferase